MESSNLTDLYSMCGSDDDEEIIQDVSNTMSDVTPQSYCNHSSNDSTTSPILGLNSALTFYTNHSGPESSVELNDATENYEEYQIKNIYTSTPVPVPVSIQSDVKFLRACRLNSHEGQIKVMKEGMKKQSELLDILARESQKQWQATRSQNEQINKSHISAENAFREITKLRSDTAVEFSAVSKQLDRLESTQNHNSERIKFVAAEQINQKEETYYMNSNLRQSIRSLEKNQAQIMSKLNSKSEGACGVTRRRRKKTEVELLMEHGQKKNHQMNTEKASKTNAKLSVQNTDRELQVGSSRVMIRNHNNPDVNHTKITHKGGQSSSLQKLQKQQKGQPGQPGRTGETEISNVEVLDAKQSSPPPTVLASVPLAEPPTKKHKVNPAPIPSSLQPNSVLLPTSSQVSVVKIVGRNLLSCAYCGKHFGPYYVRKHEENYCRVGRANISNKNTLDIGNVNAPVEVQANAVLSQRVLRPRKK